MNDKKRLFLVPAVVSLVAVILAFSGFTTDMDWKMYDLMLRFRRQPQEHPSILLADFDDAAIAEIGSWPVGRNLVADGLVTMGEFGARAVVFDIEYVDRSPRGIDARYLEEDLPAVFEEGFSLAAENVRDLFSAIAQGQIPLSDAAEYADDLASSMRFMKDGLLGEVAKVAADNDTRLGLAARLYGSAYFTINMRKEEVKGNNPEIREAAMDVAGRPIVPGTEGLYLSAVDILPTIPTVLGRSAGAGFPNVHVDNDGVRRRIDLFYRFGDRKVAQLVMAPLLDILGNPEVKTSRNFFVLEGATLPEGVTTDIRIPRTEDGRMLLNWPHKDYISSFRHISFTEFLHHEQLFDDLTHNLRIREDWGYLDSYDGSYPLATLFSELQHLRRSWMDGDEEMPETAISDLREYRQMAVAEAERFFASRPEDAIVAQVQEILASGGLPENLRAQYSMILEDAPAYFENSRNILNNLRFQRDRLAREVGDSFIIVGFIATGTTDIGVNPFDGEYVNVGTHAVVYNTILQRSFLDDAPWWVSGLIAIVAAFGLSLVIMNRKPSIEIIIGFAVTVLLATGFVVIFVMTGIFIHPFVPLLACFSTFLVSTIVSFLRTEKEKGFIRNAFSHYLSSEVIREIISNPDSLKLGGTKKHMTAVFTDIKGFSTISEKLTPEDLVRLLNQYLSSMSDIILDLKGTIDKYEGDAIIAFFGAPLDLADHAARACHSAVSMKKMEQALNQKFLSAGVAPSPLLTRVGLNTGDMVVGNMGTERKMDYTIIGDAVNLAARLEGVNKQYGTWVCASEDTATAAGDGFLFRRLDRIRVVGKSQPIRLFELVDEKSLLPEEDLRFYRAFEEALDVFESRNWPEAAKFFKALLKARPEDGPSVIYVKRCQEYLKKPPVATWDGVYNLTSK
jgi:adenylate cyclase